MKKKDVTSISTLTPEQQKHLVDDAIERLDRLAESRLEMARLFLDREKPEIARRRLQEVVELYGKSDAAKEARKLLNGLS
jgi:outer membrane protein assembly factor BamD (BamD/ComL family)